MLKKFAFRIVFKTLVKNPFLTGKCNKSIKLQYMYGIHDVMSLIAEEVSNKTKSDFSKQFVKNLTESYKN